MKLSRGAQRCLKLLRWYAAHFQEVYPYRSTLAKRLGVSVRQLANYIAELKTAGLVGVSQEGPQSASYHVVPGENCTAIAQLLPSKCTASRRYPLRVTGTAEEMRARFPMQTETPSPEILSLLAWADDHGYPTGNGAELEAAQAAMDAARKPPGIAGHHQVKAAHA